MGETHFKWIEGAGSLGSGLPLSDHRKRKADARTGVARASEAASGPRSIPKMRGRRLW